MSKLDSLTYDSATFLVYWLFLQSFGNSHPMGLLSECTHSASGDPFMHWWTSPWKYAHGDASIHMYASHFLGSHWTWTEYPSVDFILLVNPTNDLFDQQNMWRLECLFSVGVRWTSPLFGELTELKVDCAVVETYSNSMQTLTICIACWQKKKIPYHELCWTCGAHEWPKINLSRLITQKCHTTWTNINLNT